MNSPLGAPAPNGLFDWLRAVPILFEPQDAALSHGFDEDKAVCRSAEVSAVAERRREDIDPAAPVKGAHDDCRGFRRGRVQILLCQAGESKRRVRISLHLCQARA